MKIIFLFLLSLSFLFSKESNSLVLSKEEINWIKENPIVKVGVDEDWPPFDYINSDFNHSGISSEYLKIISEKTGLKFEIYANSWHKVMEKIKNKELDILACAAKTPQREEFLEFTNPYLSLDIVVAGKKGIVLNSFEDVKNYRIVVQKSDYVYEILSKRFPNVEFVFVESNEDALKYISYGKADLYIDKLATISYFIEKDLLTNLEIKLKADFDSTLLAIAVTKEKVYSNLFLIKFYQQLLLKKK